MTDEELIGLFSAAEGDYRAAWAAFLKEFDGRIRRTCRYHMNRFGYPDEAEDRVQEVMISLSKNEYRAIRTFRPGRARMSTWVTKIASNECVDWFRRNHPRRTFPLATDEAGVPLDIEDPAATSPLDAISDDREGQAWVLALVECAAKLDEKRRNLFIARLLLQVSVDRKVTMSEVGRIFGHTPQRTKYQLDATLAQLHKCAQKKLAEEEPS